MWIDLLDISKSNLDLECYVSKGLYVVEGLHSRDVNLVQHMNTSKFFWQLLFSIDSK